MNTPRPHDLLWFTAPDDLHFAEVRPDWADDAWLQQVPVVVRREQLQDEGLIAVGVRGRLRQQRAAAFLPKDKVLRAVTPEALAGGRSWQQIAATQRVPCLQILDTLADLLDQRGIAWGPSGGVGFTLATGINVLRPDSDLDLLWRSTAPIARSDAANLLALLRTYPVHIDLQIDTGYGGFALAEWLAGRDRILLKTASGPLLLADPWQWPDAERRLHNLAPAA